MTAMITATLPDGSVPHQRHQHARRGCCDREHEGYCESAQIRPVPAPVGGLGRRRHTAMHSMRGGVEAGGQGHRLHFSRWATTHHTRGDVREPTVRPDRCRRPRPRVSSRELRGSAVEPRGSDDASTSLSTAFYPNSGTQRSSFAHSKRAQRNALRLHLRAFRARDALRATGMPPPCEEVRLAPAACCSGQDRIAILALARRLSLDAPSLACIDMP